MPRRTKAPRPSPSTYYPSQQHAAPSVFGNDRGRIGFPRAGRLTAYPLAMCATRGPMASASAITPDSGRTITVNWRTSPFSSNRR